MAAEGDRESDPSDKEPEYALPRVFAANLRRERLRQGKSMRGLAEKAGMYASEISRLERGLRDPRLSTMLRIAMALEVSLVDLLATARSSVEARSSP
jgi:transcriptional regulator with XRE-family HTH domain